MFSMGRFAGFNMARGQEPSLYQRSGRMKVLLRLAGWGTAASLALTVAVFTATSNTGSRRLAAALTPTANQAIAAVPAVPVARFQETEAETRRLANAVQSLHSDRERLLARIASLERNLEDVTGSIQRQSVAEPAVPPPAAEPSPALASAPSAPPASIPAAPASPVEPQDPQQNGPADPSPPQAAYGVDVGGAVNFEGLRALWNSTRTAFASAIEGMRPVLGMRENPKTRNTEFRLVIGPLPDAAAAATFCATLTAARRYCHPVPFEGQQLSFAAPAPPRRPAATQERKTPPRPPARTP
jgi:hypothetical protein